MKNLIIGIVQRVFCLLLLISLLSFTKVIAQSNDCIDFQKEFGELFVEVQLKEIFDDPKIFPDCTPQRKTKDIMKSYYEERSSSDFDLKAFVSKNFFVPFPIETAQSGFRGSVELALDELWDVIEPLEKSKHKPSSYISLPKPYVVPKGTTELRYWEGYYIMVWLKAAKEYEMLDNMVENFAYLIDYTMENGKGHIPEGNRAYYLDRTAPPMFALMLELYAERKEGWKTVLKYLPQLQAEYNFWMYGFERLEGDGVTACNRIVKMPDGEYLNRYWSNDSLPRTECYLQDVKLAEELGSQSKENLYRNLRASSESGWIHSGRWLSDTRSLKTIETTEIIPVDLNCLLYIMEQTLGDAFWLYGSKKVSKIYYKRATNRAKAINKYLWDRKTNCYSDYHLGNKKSLQKYSLASIYPLYAGISSDAQASFMAEHIETLFLKNGGVVSSFQNTGSEWDAPYGTAPMQWMTIKALENYLYDDLAAEVKRRWMSTALNAFQKTGKLAAFYNMERPEHTDDDIKGSFKYTDKGWTNAILLDLLLENYKP